MSRGLGDVYKIQNLDLAGIKKPVLVSGTDGVGTKLKVAFMMDKHDTIGQDGVAMCVNDILCQGAKPLFFLDYLGTGRLKPEMAADIVKGISDGCVLADCALIGGETAEMPGFYDDGEYDMAGFTVGIVDKEKIIDGSKIAEGDLVIGLPSSGIHSNGYSLVRKIFFEKYNYSVDDFIESLNMTLGEALIEPTKIYVKPCLEVLKEIDVHGMVHVTGGGFYENIPRIMPEKLGVEINTRSFEIPEIFKWMQKLGNIDTDEMFSTFNMGIGMIMIVGHDDAERTIEMLKAAGENVSVIGKVVRAEGVKLCHA
jgi:phosphoribosylformylglycinamidine cyclo-ligase